jgi:hypothetical protein
LAFSIQPAKAKTIVVPYDYPTIQAAINAASDGDSIFVKYGTYYEGAIHVNKTVSITGELIAGYWAKIDAGGKRAFYVLANGVQISDLHITNTTGILIIADNVKISNTIIGLKNEYSKGIYAIFSNGLEINNNIIVGRGNAISAVGCVDALINVNLLITKDISMDIEMSNNLRVSNNVFLSPTKIINSTNVQFFWNIFHSSSITIINSEAQWDNGYPSGGNWWKQYSGVDAKHGPYQDQPGGDGIGDTPYVIAPGNIDRYPLMNEPYFKDRLQGLVLDVGFSPNEVSPGENVWINVTVKNSGSCDA